MANIHKFLIWCLRLKCKKRQNITVLEVYFIILYMEHFDIIIIGAGLSGIDAACHFKKYCPDKTFMILEGRDNIGGTWDLFKYPGIRSDSDMHTFSYSFKPWNYSKTISDANTIMDYLRETVEEYDIGKYIRFNQWVEAASWSSENNTWTIRWQDKKKGMERSATCNFLMFCTGYYDYDEGYTPEFEGLEKYKGRFIHPQKWTSDITYENKNVIVIGSGATAITLVPTLAEKTNHVYMIQRSPSYILSRPLYDRFAKIIHKILPDKIAHFLSRWKNILLSMYLYRVSRKNPKAVSNYIKGQIKKELGKDYDVDTHFSPKYNPWDERLCVVPDNDLFHSIKDGKCSIITDHIDAFTENGVQLKSGKKINADLIVSATGLKLKLVGGMKVFVDNQKIDPSELMTYKGIMLQNIPNAATIAGYTNASWTLKADLACSYVCRLINYMDKHKFKSCQPVLKNEEIKREPIIDFSSGYIQRSLDKLPKQGDEFPWKLHQNYLKDMLILKYKKINDDVLEFK